MDIGAGNSVAEQESNQNQDSWIPKIPSKRPVLQRTMSTYEWRRHGEFVVRTAGENTAHCVEVPSLDSTSSSKANRKISSRYAAVEAGVQVPKVSTREALDPMAGWNNIPFVQLGDKIWSGLVDSPDDHTASSGLKEQNRIEDCNLPTPQDEYDWSEYVYSWFISCSRSFKNKKKDGHGGCLAALLYICKR